MSKTYYGFHAANHADESAWFHTESAARRFAIACGWPDAPIETTTGPAIPMDTPKKPWFKNQKAAALGRMGKGVPKNYTPAEREKRREQMKKINARKKAKKK